MEPARLPRLKWHLRTSGVSLAAFGRKVGLSESLISKLCNDLIDPTPAVRQKLDRHFGKRLAAQMLERTAFLEYCAEIGSGK